MRKQVQDKLDETELKFNVEWARTHKDLKAWVANMKVVSLYDENEKEFSALLVYVITDEGNCLKLLYDVPPYFYVECDEDFILELSLNLETKFEKQLLKVEIIERVDLEQINHLSGKRRQFIKLSFRVISDLVLVRNQLRARVERNKKMETNQDKLINKPSTTKDVLDSMRGLREYDVPYHCRVCIDTELRCCKWFQFTLKERRIVKCEDIKEMLGMPELNYMAFDIETTKQPLKFPDSKSDKIMMISITYKEQSVLITNMTTLGQEVQQFDYAPKPEFATTAIIYNEADEKSLLQRFFTIITDYKPLIIVSFNGDRFDWPFIDERCKSNGFYMENEIGVIRNEESNEYYGRYMIHMDCFAWVERDAYLPQGSHGLKAVTKAKLGYQPVEVDPEQMVPMALSDSQQFAGYSISDSVATYWLYKKHIHDFILALCTIIPLSPDEVLRKGSGTLCECLLMAKAYQREIVFPNKTISSQEKSYKGHLIDTETYIGGKVECLRSGIYRSDFDVEFKLDKECMQIMWNGVERLIRFVGKIENQTFSEEEIEQCSNKIRLSLEGLMVRGENFKEKPLIYHLDVAAMYPNIILTNRLQPVSIVENRICSGCVFNQNESQCKRNLEWQWKVEYFPLKSNEVEYVKQQLEQEQLEKAQREMEQQMMKLRLEGGDPRKMYLKNLYDLPVDQYIKLLKQRVKLLSQKTYKMAHIHEIVLKKDTVCMRENDFYVQTVREFRDRRYEFKELVKVYKGKLEQAKKEGQGVKECHDMMALYESLQLAHKIILNSFYGYVMRKGARWYSMPMAGIVTHMGSQIISTAKQWVDQIGLPLELDTDGIWCLLPQGFPEDFTIKCISGRNLKFSYPCYILNELVHEKYKNNQYQWLKDPKTLDYGIRSEMSIFFEVDGPYRCMIIPAAREENKQLKKRYVVYNKNGSIAEIKGFEIKRRGELQIIKQFQMDLFSEFLKGTNLKECYQACAEVAKKLLQILTTGGEGLPQSKLLELICESRVLSKEITEYDSQKGVAITAGRRIAEYLGSDQMRGGSLNCQYIITKYPHNTPVNERSIPVLIFESSLEVRRKYLKKWLKDNSLNDENLSLSKIVDWNYYIERLKNTVQKLLVIPAALQNIESPIPEVEPPEWLLKRLREKASGLQQMKINKYFNQVNKLAQQFAQIRFQPMEIEGTAKKKQQEEPLRPMHNQYNCETDFKNFLKVQKQIWTKAYRNKVNNPITGRGNLKNMIKISQQQLLSQTWHILQYYELEPGIFSAWLMLENGTLSCQQIQVDRTIYVNSYVKEPYQTTVKKLLPRDKEAHFLYNITMSESKFQKDYNNLQGFDVNPEHEGVYEQNIPLMFKLVSELGSMCKLNRLTQQKPIYKFEDLQIVQVQNINEQYLQRQQNTLFQNSFIIIHQQLQDHKAVWTVIYDDEAVVIIVRKFDEKLKRDDEKLYINSFKDQIEAKRKQLKDQIILFPEKNKIFVQIMKDDKLAIDYIQNSFEARGSGAKLCILHSNKELNYLQNLGMSFLCHKIATLCIPSQNKTQNLGYQWDVKTVTQQVESFCQLPIALNELLEYAKFAKIPLCNITCAHLGKMDTHQTQSEKLGYIMDVLFQRILRIHSSNLSWYGSGLGRDNRDLIPTEFTKTHFENPGMYMDYTAEIDILHFSINTIAQSGELENLDKEASSLIGKNGKQDYLSNLDELVAAKTSFKILKALVQGCLDDIVNNECEVSDQLIQNVVCWIHSGQSPLYDPYLGKLVKRLNFKFFSFLTRKLMQLGAKIVSASPQRLLISTGKQQIDQAKGYIDYIKETILEIPLFKYLKFSTSKFFPILIYKDKFNYLGLAQSPEIENYTEYACQFGLAEFLPKIPKKFYQTSLLEILKVAEIFKKKQLDEMQGLPKNLQIVQTNTLASDTINHIIKYIEKKFSQKVYDAIQSYNDSYQAERKNYEVFLEQEKTMEIEELNTKKNRKIIEDEDQEDYEENSFVVADDREEEEDENQEPLSEQLEEEEDGKVDNFPSNWQVSQVIGSLRRFEEGQDQPILRAIVYLCAMLSVDEDVHQIMKRVKSNCCRILKIQEHSQAADFEDPCMDFIIHNVPCFRCFMVSDISVFKDNWNCQGCSEEYDINTIETKICQVIEQQLLFYQNQDLYCQRCKQTQDYPFQDRCSCGAVFILNKDQFEKCFIKNPHNFFENMKQLALHKNLLGLQTLACSVI